MVPAYTDVVSVDAGMMDRNLHSLIERRYAVVNGVDLGAIAEFGDKLRHAVLAGFGHFRVALERLSPNLKWIFHRNGAFQPGISQITPRAGRGKPDIKLNCRPDCLR